MPEMLYTYPATTIPALTSLTTAFAEPFTLHITFPVNFGGFAFITPQSNFTLPALTIAAMEAYTGSAMLLAGSEVDYLIEGNSKLHIYYVALTGSVYSTELSTEYFNDVNIDFVPPMPRAEITPDPTAVYTESTTFNIRFPYETGGFVLLGNDPLPYDAGSIDMNYMQSLGYGIQAEGSMDFVLDEPTRVRVFYFPSSSYHGYYEALDSFITDLFINVNAVLRVTVLDYGNTVSFEDSTQIKLFSNMECDFTYSLINLELGTEEHASMVLNGLFQISITSSSVIRFKAIGTNNTVERAYHFRKEPKDSKTIYSTYTQGENVLDNFDSNFLDTYSGSVGQFTFSPITNSALAGIYPPFVFGNNNASSYTWYVYGESNRTVRRFHFRLVNARYMGLKLFFNDLECLEEEGWYVSPITYQGTTEFVIRLENTNFSPRPLAKVYLEIDAYDKLLPPSPYYYSYNFPNSSWFRISDNPSFEVSAYLPNEAILAVTTDGTKPDPILNLVPVVNGNYVYTQNLLETTIAREIVYRIGTQEERLNGYVPEIVADQLSKFFNLYDVLSYNTVEDFSLGLLRFNWFSNGGNTFKLTPNGLDLGYRESIYAATDLYGITGKQVKISYNLIPDPYTGNFEGEAYFCLSNAQNYCTYAITGIHTTTIDLNYEYTSLNITVANNDGYTNQKLIVTGIELVGYVPPTSNKASIVPSLEMWPNGQPSLPWSFTGNWQPMAPLINASTMYFIPPTFESLSVGFRLTVYCLDGNVIFNWGSLVYNTNITDCYMTLYIDDNNITSIYGNFGQTSFSTYVELGWHTFLIMTTKRNALATDNLFIESITFPSLDVPVYDHATKDAYNEIMTVEYLYGTQSEYNIDANYAWSWKTGHEICPVEDEVAEYGVVLQPGQTSTMSIELPLTSDQWGNSLLNFTYRTITEV